MLRRLETIRIAEEAGDMDENTLVQSVEFGLIGGQQVDVVLERGQLSKRHAPGNPAANGGWLVQVEIDPSSCLEKAADPSQAIFAGPLRWGKPGVLMDPKVLTGTKVRMAIESGQLNGNTTRR